MNVQEIIVGLIVGLCLYWVGRRMVHYIKRIKDKTPTCVEPGKPVGCNSCAFLQSCMDKKKNDF